MISHHRLELPDTLPLVWSKYRLRESLTALSKYRFVKICPTELSTLIYFGALELKHRNIVALSFAAAQQDIAAWGERRRAP